MLPGAVGLGISFIINSKISNNTVTIIFDVFVFILIIYTVHGLLAQRLNTTDTKDGSSNEAGGTAKTVADTPVADNPVTAAETEVKSATRDAGDLDSEGGGGSKTLLEKLLEFPAWYTQLAPTWPLLIGYSFCCVIGGILVGLIGIGVEKITFILATWGARGIHVRSASVSSIAITGWLSGIALVVHLIAPRCPASPGYEGAVPFRIWLCTLPGVFMGSFVGPWFAQKFGSRTVIWLFVVFLCFNLIEDSLKVTGIVGSDTCYPAGAPECRALFNVTQLNTTFYDGYNRPIELLIEPFEDMGGIFGNSHAHFSHSQLQLDGSWERVHAAANAHGVDMVSTIVPAVM